MRKMRNSHGRTWNKVRNTENFGKFDTHIVERGKWRETVKNVKNEKYTLYDLEYGENQ